MARTDHGDNAAAQARAGREARHGEATSTLAWSSKWSPDSPDYEHHQADQEHADKMREMDADQGRDSAWDPSWPAPTPYDAEGMPGHR